MAFAQPDQENTFTELVKTVSDLDLGAALIGIGSVLLLVAWDRSKRLKKSLVPAPLLVVLLGVALNLLFRELGGIWTIGTSHLVQVPTPENFSGFCDLFRSPDFSRWNVMAVYTAAMTLAAVASLETLINLEAVDKLDPHSAHRRPAGADRPGGGEPRFGSPGRAACHVGHCAQFGEHRGRSTNQTIVDRSRRATALQHDVPDCMAQLDPAGVPGGGASGHGGEIGEPVLVRQMWAGGRSQFIPFIATVVAIVLTDLLVGVLVGMIISTGFVLWSSVRRPIRRVVEKHLGGEVVHIELANQVSFLNRAALARALDEVPAGGHILLDARSTDYIDPDVLDLLRDFKAQTGPARNIEVSMLGSGAGINSSIRSSTWTAPRASCRTRSLPNKLCKFSRTATNASAPAGD